MALGDSRRDEFFIVPSEGVIGIHRSATRGTIVWVSFMVFLFIRSSGERNILEFAFVDCKNLSILAVRQILKFHPVHSEKLIRPSAKCF